jgi:tRNA dimethylallyltransferase
MRAIGVPELAQVVEGKMGLAEGLAIAQRSTRNYIKRQLTWARRNMIASTWLQENDSERITEEFANFICRHG